MQGGLTILNRKISELALSESFKAVSAGMGFNNLQEVVNAKPEDLIGNKQFNYVWMGELVDFLAKNELLYLLQPTQGNSEI